MSIFTVIIIVHRIQVHSIKFELINEKIINRIQSQEKLTHSNEKCATSQPW